MTSKFKIDGELVEATLSAGGSFYEVTIIKTGYKFRALADAFDAIATPYEGEENG